MNYAGGQREIAIVVYPSVQSLDVTGPLEVFAAASNLVESAAASERGYSVRVLSSDGGPVTTSSGLSLSPHGLLSDVSDGLDTVICAGGPGCLPALADRRLLDWTSEFAPECGRVASVCTGAFLLAEAGLLDGKRATTHWAAAAELARRYPRIQVDPEPIFLRDGTIWTSAGVTAGMDLALALVEEDLGRDTALAVARHLVLFLRRPGNQAQFSAALAAQQSRRQPVRETQRFVIEHPAADLTVEALAQRVHMSPRHFARCFADETGMTPGRYVERVRLEAARRQLEDTSESIATIAAVCGFGSAETMRRAFLRKLGTPPSEYRSRFQRASRPQPAIQEIVAGD